MNKGRPSICFLDYGIRVAPGSDYTPGPFEPMMALQSCVTRTDTKGNVWGPKQKITVAETIRASTRNGAYASFEENVKGTLDLGSGTKDPDAGQSLRYQWFLYKEAGFADGALALIDIAGADTTRATITPVATCRPGWLKLGPGAARCPATGVAHIILAVTDNGSPRLTSYRRIVMKVHQDAGSKVLSH